MLFAEPLKVVRQLKLKLGDHVADFGAGSGYYTHAISQIVGDEGRVYAIDVQDELLEELKQNARRSGINNIEIIHGDLEAERGSRLRDNSVDAVLISNLLFQTHNQSLIAKEAMRILKDGGVVLCVEWQESFGGIGPPDKYVVEPDVVTSIFYNENSVLDREINTGRHHYGLVFRKEIA